MKALRLLALGVTCLIVFTGSLEAAPLNVTLVRTSVLYNEDPPGAPLPLGRTQYDAGNIMYQGVKVGEYLRVKDVHDGTLNVAAVQITLFFNGIVMTLQGSHSFNTGNEVGGISASSAVGVAGHAFSLAGATSILTLLFP